MTVYIIHDAVYASGWIGNQLALRLMEWLQVLDSCAMRGCAGRLRLALRDGRTVRPRAKLPAL